MKAIKFILCLILFSVAFVCAAPLFIIPEAQTGGGLIIDYNKDPYIKANESLMLSFHVYNSTGKPMYNSTTSCYLMLHNKTGHTILAENLTQTPNMNEFYLQVNASYFLRRGTYSYVMHCQPVANQNTEHGLVSYILEATTYGHDPEQPNSFLAFLAALPIIFVILVYAGLCCLTNEHYLVREILYFLLPIGFFSSLQICLQILGEYYVDTALSDAAAYLLQWTGIVYFLLICYYMIYFIIKIMEIRKYRMEE